MAGGGPARGSAVYEELPCRSIMTWVLPGPAAKYNSEPRITGWLNITAEISDAYIYFGHGDKWDYTAEGVFVPQNKTITRRLDDMPIGYYSVAGVVRLEMIEFVKLLED